MALPMIFSRRARLVSGASVDVYQYDSASKKLRTQTQLILRAAMGDFYENSGYNKFRSPSADCYQHVVEEMRLEQGQISLVKAYTPDADDELFGWMENADTLPWIDAVEMCFQIVDKYIRRERDRHATEHFKVDPDRAIEDFNGRCREAGFGYQYTSGYIVRLDSELLHSEAVVPALGLLAAPRFVAADTEFRAAHAAYRSNDHTTCLVECLKAFESVLKVIGHERKWIFDEHDPASKLIAAAVTAGFLAGHTATAGNHLASLLTSSIPATRNKNGGHGGGLTPHDVPAELAAFQLHQTAATILFLVQRDERLPK